MSKLTKADAKRIQDLKAKVDIQKKKNEDEKKRLLKLKKELDNENKKIANGWKDLKNAQKQLANDKKFLESTSKKQNAKDSRKSTGGGGQWQSKYMDMKKTADREGKQARDYKKRVDQLEAEMKILKRKLKNLAGRKGGKEDPRIKALKKENKMLKKKLRMLMKELAKKRRWFQRTIKLFKANQNAWIKKQQDAFKNKGFIIKYVFLDDVKRITQYGRPGKDKWRFKNKIKVRTKGGGEVVLKDIEIMILDGTFNDDLDDEDDNDTDKNGSKSKKKKKGKKKGDGNEEDDATKKKKKKKKGANGEDIDEDDATIVGESEEDDGKSGKKKKKGKKTAEDREDEIEQYMMELEAEFGLMNDDALGDDDDYKTDPELDKIDDDDDGGDDDDDAKDKDGDNDNEDDNDDDDDDVDSGGSEELAAQIIALNQESEARNDDLKKLQEILNDKESNPDPVAAAQELAKTIESRQESVADNLKSLNASNGTIDNFKEHGNNYASFILNLSKSIAGNSVNFDKLCELCDYFNKELQGRIEDLSKINEIYYNEYKQDNSNDDDGNKPPFDVLKDGVSDRHGDIAKAIEGELDKEDGGNDDGKEEAKEDDAEVNPDDPNANSKKETSENGEKVKEMYDKLLINNKEYNDALGESSGKYDTAQNEKAKLVSEFYSRYQSIETLIQKINNVPSTKIDLDNNDNNNNDNNDDNQENVENADNDNENADGANEEEDEI